MYFFKVFLARELLDHSVAIIKSALSGVIIDPDRLVLGCEEGLYCLDLDRTGASLQKKFVYNTY